jgi:hypothetical protein
MIGQETTRPDYPKHHVQHAETAAPIAITEVCISQFSGLFPSFGYLHTQSSLQPVHKPASSHPNVR